MRWRLDWNAAWLAAYNTYHSRLLASSTVRRTQGTHPSHGNLGQSRVHPRLSSAAHWMGFLLPCGPCPKTVGGSHRRRVLLSGEDLAAARVWSNPSNKVPREAFSIIPALTESWQTLGGGGWNQHPPTQPISFLLVVFTDSTERWTAVIPPQKVLGYDTSFRPTVEALE